MRIKLTSLLATFIILSAVGCANHPLSISLQVRVPTEFQQDPPGWISPTGEPESVRYKRSYEAFWWNCVMLKAENFESRCPFTCSGTPAATFGCSDGALDAERQIKQLLKVHDKMKVKQYLQTIASDQVGKEKMKSYFPDGPRAEKVVE